MSTAYPTPGGNEPTNPYAQPAQPAQPTPAPTQEPKKKGGCMKWGAGALGILIVLAILGSCGGGDDKAGTPSTTTDATETEIVTSTADTPAAETTAQQSAAAPAAPAPAAKKNDDVPREYKNALRQAENYIKTMPFSYQGLYDQLTSEYGGKFPPEAAQYAMDNLTVDWNAEALEAAKNYQDAMPMSDDQLFDQLTSEYGSQFTPEEAQYAIDHLAD